MAKDLEEALTNIETKLGGSQKPHMDLGEHLEYIESLIGGGSSGSGIEDVKVNGTSVVEDKTANIKLKTVNGELITGEGNIASGTQLYRHIIRFTQRGYTSPDRTYASVSIISSQQEVYTFETFYNYLFSIGCISKKTALPINRTHYDSHNKLLVDCYIYAENNDIQFYGSLITINISDGNISLSKSTASFGSDFDNLVDTVTVL